MTEVTLYKGVTLPKEIAGEKFLALWESGNKAIQETNYLHNIWDRSHTMFTWENLVCTYQDDWKNLRQVAAELANKRAALSENKWRMIKQADKLKRMHPETLEYDKTCERLSMAVERYEGALKDVNDLKVIHDKLVEKLGGLQNITAEEFYRLEHVGHIKRAMVQAIRDFRMTGRISVGNQEYLEQCGINPTFAFKEISQYMIAEENAGSGIQCLVKFVSRFTQNFLDEQSEA